MKKVKNAQERGSALLITITLIVIGSALASSLASIMANSAMTTRSHLDSMEALFMAESGLEAARFALPTRDNLVREACGSKDNPNRTLALTTIRAGGVALGQYQGTLTYNAGSTTVVPTLTLTSSGYVPSLADPRGRRNLEWRNVRCSSSYAPVYGSNRLSSVSNSYIKINTRNKWRDSNENCDSSITTGCNAVDENSVNIDAPAPTEANSPYASFPVFPNFRVSTGATPIPSPSGGVYTLYNSTAGSPKEYPTLTLSSSTNRQVNFTSTQAAVIATCNTYCYDQVCQPDQNNNPGVGTCPLEFHLNSLVINTANATITMLPGTYYIEDIWVRSGRKTPKFNITAGYSDAYSVTLHVKYFKIEDDTEINYNNSVPPYKPGRFTLYNHDPTLDPTFVPTWGRSPYWYAFDYQLDWTDPLKMAGVLFGAPNTNTRISSGSYTFNGGMLSRGVFTINNPIAITYDNAAIAAVQSRMNNVPAPIRLSRGQWRENFN
ncbi:MAG: pilus assembly PilX N-terminal domain-containing protein [Magnetococcales bacterium]|nr:pilus assembly PilX N-terminal domain-containing protein [Magnetococcales bacterium]